MGVLEGPWGSVPSSSSLLTPPWDERFFIGDVVPPCRGPESPPTSKTEAKISFIFIVLFLFF